MQRLAYIANALIPSRRASTAHVLNMSAGFAQTGAEVTLIARGNPEDSAQVFSDFGLSTGFEIRLQPALRFWLLDRTAFVHRIRTLLGGGHFDFVYGRSCYGLLAGVPQGLGFAYDLHAFPELARHRRLESLLFRRPNFLFATAISKALAERYLVANPALNGRILVAPCAAKGPDGPIDCDRPREPGPLRVYYVGHLYPGRGIELIVELARLEPRTEFHVVGGEDRDIASWKGMGTKNLHFHGYVKPALLPAHYERADVCIAPYATGVAVAGGGDTSAGMSPMKIFEYMAYGKPIIASDLAVLREVIEDGVDGLLSPPFKVSSWREKLHALQHDPLRRRQLGQAARAKFERRFTWERRAQIIVDAAADFKTVHGTPALPLAR